MNGSRNIFLEPFYKQTWLEPAELFQAFCELDEVKNKKEEIRLIRQLIDEDVDAKSDDEEAVC
jgi:hypothetical protein